MNQIIHNTIDKTQSSSTNFIKYALKEPKQVVYRVWIKK